MLKNDRFTNGVWPAPLIPTIPSHLIHAKDRFIPLSNREENEWQFCFEEISGIPSAFAQKQDYDFSRIAQDAWQNVLVPGSLIMQGFNIKNNCEYYYKRELHLPPDFVGKRVYLRFEGVYSHARVWVNNRFITHHTGGFTCWDCDISGFAGQGPLTLIVGVTDLEGNKKCPWNPDGIMMSDSAWASYYAHCNIGGILRDVTLFALPNDYIARNHINTTFCGDDQKWELSVALEVHSSHSGMEVLAELIDENHVPVQSETISLDENSMDSSDDTKPVMNPSRKWKNSNRKGYKNDRLYQNYYVHTASAKKNGEKIYSAVLSMNVKNPKLWDAEHPNLYKLKLSLKTGGIIQQTNSLDVGFREITYGGKKSTPKNRVYINGKEIKLRGVCRHDVSHLYGRSLTKEEIYHEILTYKRNNINHIRTSHYPASDELLSVCDQLGIYVEQENSACFKGANQFEIYNPPQDFVNTFAEMIESARNHPSVIIWSLANESNFEKSYAFRTEYNYVKSVDDTRPVIFSYPHTVHSKPRPFDLYSAHYKPVTSKLGKKNIPMLHDEFAHVSCYNLERLLYDNSSREAWGESIKKGWDNIYKTDGALGCAIWGGVDDVFYIPDTTSESHQSHAQGQCAGYGEWGCIFDAYKREKPEAYLTKKAFSPVVLKEAQTEIGKTTTIHVENRFDHTALDEIKMICKTAEGELLFDGLISEKILPHHAGKISFPNPGMCDVHIRFYHGEYLVDEYAIGNKTQPALPCPSPKELRVALNQVDSSLELRTLNDDMIAKGPAFFINETQIPLKKVTCENGLWTAVGIYKQILQFQIKAIHQNNALYFEVTPKNSGASNYSFKEIRMEFALYNSIHSVSWNRNALHSVYPENHLGRSTGTAMLKREHCEQTPDQYGHKPDWAWEQDMQNYFLFSKTFPAPHVTNDFKTRRNDIVEYTVNFEDKTGLKIQTESSKIHAFTDLFVTPKSQLPRLEITKGKKYNDLAWGNYKGERTKLSGPNPFRFCLSFVEYE